MLFSIFFVYLEIPIKTLFISSVHLLSVTAVHFKKYLFMYFWRKVWMSPNIEGYTSVLASPMRMWWGQLEFLLGISRSGKVASAQPVHRMRDWASLCVCPLWCAGPAGHVWRSRMWRRILFGKSWWIELSCRNGNKGYLCIVDLVILKTYN